MANFFFWLDTLGMIPFGRKAYSLASFYPRDCDPHPGRLGVAYGAGPPREEDEACRDLLGGLGKPSPTLACHIADAERALEFCAPRSMKSPVPRAKGSVGAKAGVIRSALR